ncbi:MAG: hypothetical protein OXU19_15930 [bacterium]|nr:hypothetical protein [bacterium]
MARRPTGPKRRARCVMATDSEWQRLREAAAAAGLSISDYVLRVLRAPPSLESDDAGQALPARLQMRVARAVLVLECIERLRLDRADMGAAWQEIVAEVDGWLEGEAALG